MSPYIFHICTRIRYNIIQTFFLLQHVSIIIHIIFRELVGSVLKSLNSATLTRNLRAPEDDLKDDPNMFEHF
jgi:hypothetical protein